MKKDQKKKKEKKKKKRKKKKKKKEEARGVISVRFHTCNSEACAVASANRNL